MSKQYPTRCKHKFLVFSFVLLLVFFFPASLACSFHPIRMNGLSASLLKGRGRDEDHVTQIQEINGQRFDCVWAYISCTDLRAVYRSLSVWLNWLVLVALNQSDINEEMKLLRFVLLTFEIQHFPQWNLNVKVGYFLSSGSQRLIEALIKSRIKTNDVVNSFIPSHQDVNKMSQYFICICRKFFFKAFHKWSNTFTSTIFNHSNLSTVDWKHGIESKCISCNQNPEI